VSYNIALLRALAPGRPVSGEVLGRELGMSRAAIWKAVRRLVALGVEVEAVPGRGYRLAQALSLLDAETIRAALPAEVAARLCLLDVVADIASTNARVLAAERPVGELVASLAEYQSAGRGRRGRRWLSAPGAGICLSVGGRLARAPADYAPLPTAVGVACAAALEGLGVPRIGLKWPNDLLLDGRKLGGVLIELRGEAQGPSTVAVGIGLNVQLGPAGLSAIERAGGLPPADLARLPEIAALGRNAVAAALIAAIADCLHGAPAGHGEAMQAGWRHRDVLWGRAVQIEGPGTQQAGIARGIDRSGALLLEGADGVCHRVTAGEVSLRPVT
jgi:BirA family transcriptional regulator, biotin operon repressor / biotin---[acetyl-CoA-carboxylase] ligase